MRSSWASALVVVVLAAGVASSAEYTLPARGLCAHRGASATHPENTLAAFREAIRLGAHMIEFDVYVARDGRLAVIHDPTVDRTTDGKGKVCEKTLDELKQLDAGAWKSPEFKGERIPTLEEVLDLMPRNVWLNVHLKEGKEAGEKAARAVAAAGRLHQAVLACGKEAADAARGVVPGILICNMDRNGDAEAYVTLTLERKAPFIQLSLPIREGQLPALTRRLKDAGVRINYFGTDSADELRRLFAAGVDFPLVNDVGALMETAKELGMPPVQPIFEQPK